YSPVQVDAIAGSFPGDLAVKASEGTQPALFNSAKTLLRYWTLSGNNITSDLSFHYLDSDVLGSVIESNLSLLRYDGHFANAGGSTNATNNTATISGVSPYSDWTLFEPGGASQIGGVIKSNDGSPISSVTVNL